MSTHQTSAKPRSSKCRHFCFPFDSHNYCPTCRESGKGDYPCVTNQSPCNICASFSEEQQIKIKHRRRYVRKQKASDPCNTSKEDDLDLLGDDVDAFLALKQTLRVFQASMLEAMKSRRNALHEKRLRIGCSSDVRLDLYQKLDPVNSPTLLRLGLQFPPLGCSTNGHIG